MDKNNIYELFRMNIDAMANAIVTKRPFSYLGNEQQRDKTHVRVNSYIAIHHMIDYILFNNRE